MKNRRGFLLGETIVKIVIAVICIGFLVYLLASLYYNNVNEQKLELAKASLQNLVDEINAGATEVEIYNPSGWGVLSWPYKEIMPKLCSNLGWENCICICTKSKTTFRPQGYANNCDDKGVCLEYGKRIIVGDGKKQNPIKIEDPPLKLNIKYGDEVLVNEL